MNCPKCNNSDYYFGIMGHNCVNSNCSLPGNKRQPKIIKDIYIADTGEKYIDSEQYPGFYEWINHP